MLLLITFGRFVETPTLFFVPKACHRADGAFTIPHDLPPKCSTKNAKRQFKHASARKGERQRQAQGAAATWCRESSAEQMQPKGWSAALQC